MRTSLNLDQDVYDFASAYGDAKGITLAAAINELVRRAEQVPPPVPETSRLKQGQHGYLVIAASDHKVTSETVKRFSEDPLV